MSDRITDDLNRGMAYLADAFDDGPPIGIGSDGNVHDDPYCAAIAPMGSYEASHGEVCGKCEGRRLGAKTAAGLADAAHRLERVIEGGNLVSPVHFAICTCGYRTLGFSQPEVAAEKLASIHIRRRTQAHRRPR